MNDRNNIPNFEQFLRTSVEDFRMMPARKIWYGIYNQMHPSKKWPSLAVSLIILIAIMFVGISNNNKVNSGSLKNSTPFATTNAAQQQQVFANNENIANNTPNKNAIVNLTNNENATTTNNNVDVNIALLDIENIALEKDATKNENVFLKNANNTALVNTTNENKLQVTTIANNIELNEKIIFNNNIETNTEAIKNTADDLITQTKNSTNPVVAINENVNIGNENLSTEIATNTTVDNVASINIEIAKVDDKNKTIVQKEIVEKNSYTSNNKTNIRKLKEKGSLLYYLTPSIGYRKLGTNGVKNATPNQQPFNIETLKDEAALNLELGATLQYNKRKNIVTKVGIQLNYTNYVSKVVDLGHTLQTTLATNSFSATRNPSVSSYLTKEGSDRLNKTTWQIAVPIGADVMLLGNDKIKWNVGATLQPTYIFGGSAMVLSYDTKNYISEKSLLRKLNMNAAIETYVTFKTGKGINLNVGPQFRYQLFSTYKSAYNYSEKLFNLGVKVGVSTRF